MEFKLFASQVGLCSILASVCVLTRYTRNGSTKAVEALAVAIQNAKTHWFDEHLSGCVREVNLVSSTRSLSEESIETSFCVVGAYV